MDALNYYNRSPASTQDTVDFQVYNSIEDRDEDFLRANLHAAQNATTEHVASPTDSEKEEIFRERQKTLSNVVGAYLTYHTGSLDPPNNLYHELVLKRTPVQLAVEVTVETGESIKSYQTVCTDDTRNLFLDPTIWQKKPDAIKAAAQAALGAYHIVPGMRLREHLSTILSTNLGASFDNMGMHSHNNANVRYRDFEAIVSKGTVLPTKQEVFHNPLRLMKINADLQSFDDFNTYITLEINEFAEDGTKFVINFSRYLEKCFQISHVGYVGSDEGLNSTTAVREIKAVDKSDPLFQHKTTYTYATLGTHKRHINLLNIHAYLSQLDLLHFESDTLKIKKESKPDEWTKYYSRRWLDNGYIFNYNSNYTVIANSISNPFTQSGPKATFYTIFKWSSGVEARNPFLKTEINGLKQQYVSLSKEVRQMMGAQPPSAALAMDQTTNGYIATVKVDGAKGCYVLTNVNVFDYATLQTRKATIEYNLVCKHYGREYAEFSEHRFRHNGNIYAFIKEHLDLLQKERQDSTHSFDSGQYPGLFGKLLETEPITAPILNEFTDQIKMTLDALKLTYRFVPTYSASSDRDLQTILNDIEVGRARRKALRTNAAQRFMQPRRTPGQFPNPRQSTPPDRFAYRGRGGHRGWSTRSQLPAHPAPAGVYAMQAEIAELKRALNRTTLAAAPTPPASRP